MAEKKRNITLIKSIFVTSTGLMIITTYPKVHLVKQDIENKAEVLFFKTNTLNGVIKRCCLQ